MVFLVETAQHPSTEDQGNLPCSLLNVLVASKQAQAFGYTERPVVW